MIKFLDLYKQYESLAPSIDTVINRVIRQSSFIGGEDVRIFEAAFSAYQQASHCIGVGNGTDAIEIVLEALKLPPRSEVIVPANTFIATSEAVTRQGQRVVFADVDSGTYTLSPADVRRRITPSTSAILAVHLYGHPCAMDELEGICREFGLKLIEDCAQAHGAEYKGRRLGTFGVAGTFSFYPGKNLGAYGDAGAIVTMDESFAMTCRMLANHGRTGKYDHQFEGRNSRLDNLQAAILNVKLPHLEKWIDRRNRIAGIYHSELANVEGLILPKQSNDCRHAYHLFVIRCDERDRLAEFLKIKNIQTGVHYPIALPKLEAYAYLGQADEPMFANRSDTTLLSLPIGDHLSDDDARVVAAAVREFFE